MGLKEYLEKTGLNDATEELKKIKPDLKSFIHKYPKWNEEEKRDMIEELIAEFKTNHLEDVAEDLKARVESILKAEMDDINKFLLRERYETNKTLVEMREEGRTRTDLLEKTLAAVQSEQHSILLLGDTGVGKSTIACYLANNTTSFHVSHDSQVPDTSNANN